MSNSLISIGISSLNAAQIGLATAGHNIANAATPGYTRQEAIQANNPSLFTGAGYLGQGVSIATVKRAYDDFVTNQLRYTQTQASSYDSHYAQLKQINDLMADPKAGLTPALEGFFKGVQDLATHPADAAARQNMLSAAQSLSTRFHDIDSRLAQARSGANSGIENTVGLVNSYAGQIATLNREIALAISHGVTSQPNDLLDKRDTLLRDLSKEIGITVLKQDDGSVNVAIGGGQLLVATERVFQLETRQSTTDPRILDVGIKTGAGLVKLRQEDVGGGNMAGLMAFRDDSLNSVQSALDGIATALANNFNAQHKLGYDRNGTAGGDFFNIASNAPAASIAVAITNIDNIAAAQAPGAVGDNRNALALAGLQTQPLLPGGANLQGGFAQMVSQIGAKTRELEQSSQAQASLLDMTEQTQQSVSGVNLDEEAAKLLRYQQAYQAASKVIATAQTVFDSILNLGH
jgi:flagellar hook-associated protein 1